MVHPLFLLAPLILRPVSLDGIRTGRLLLHRSQQDAAREALPRVGDLRKWFARNFRSKSAYWNLVWAEQLGNATDHSVPAPAVRASPGRYVVRDVAAALVTESEDPASPQLGVLDLNAVVNVLEIAEPTVRMPGDDFPASAAEGLPGVARGRIAQPLQGWISLGGPGRRHAERKSVHFDETADGDPSCVMVVSKRRPFWYAYTQQCFDQRPSLMCPKSHAFLTYSGTRYCCSKLADSVRMCCAHLRQVIIPSVTNFLLSETEFHASEEYVQVQQEVILENFLRARDMMDSFCVTR